MNDDLQDDLEALVEEWRSYGEPMLPRLQGAKESAETCADRLEELIEEHENE